MLNETLAFLRAHLSEEDLAAYLPALFQQFAEHALMLRETAPWCRDLDEEIFLHYVLFPRVNDEDLSFHRQMFYEALWPRVKDLSRVEDVVLEVNRWCAENASYESTDNRTASPLTVYRNGSGRCGEESAFLVSALRSVGVAARQVYAPRWSHCDDNHAWVEALCGDRWRFLGACEPEPVLDRGWFNASASRALLVRSRRFGSGVSPLHGVPVGQEGNVTFCNQTARYAPTSERIFRVLLHGRPAPGAAVRLQILNEAAFHTVADLTAGENGEVRVTLGPGTVHVLAVRDGLWAEGDCESGALTLELAPASGADTGWIDFDFHAAQPSAVNPSPLDETQRTRRAETRLRCTGLRTARITSFSRLGQGEPQWQDLLDRARGNRGELLAFLSGANAPDRERLVRTLAPKDLRDTDAATLEDHFSRLPPSDGLPEEIYWRYLACPRVGREKIVPWRSGRYGAMNERERQITGLRRQGVPARLRPLDGAAEIWADGAFRPVVPEETGVLRLTCEHVPAPENWSLCRREPECWRLLDPSEAVWKDGALSLPLPAGRYRLTTSVRLPGGSQLAAARDFSVSPGGTLTVPLYLRTYAMEDALFSQPMPPTPARDPSGAIVPDIFRREGRPALLIWLWEGEEPTEHLLLELAGLWDRFAALPLDILFLVRGQDSLRYPALARLLDRRADARALLDDWAFDREDLSRRLALDPESAPLAIVCDGGGNAVCAESGYRVGSAALLLRAAACLAGNIPH